MPQHERDKAYLWDMLDAARMAQSVTSDIKYHEFLTDRVRQLALERTVEIIGEAARKISEDFKNENQDIPWKAIIAQRNVLAHEYAEIRQERMWSLVKKDIPELAEKLDYLLAQMTQVRK